MTESRERLKEVLQRLERERDELKLKVGLAKLEAREEWGELEEKIERLRGRMKVVGSEAREASGDVATALDALADEVREGIARIRKLL